MTSMVDSQALLPHVADDDEGAATRIDPVAPAPKRRRAPLVLGALTVLAVAGGAVAYTASLGKETTDDAQVEGHVSNVAARVSGQVKRVLVADNQEVKAGDVLVELDDRDYTVRVAAARADHEAALAALHAAQTQLAVTEKSTKSSLVVARGGLTQASALQGTTRASIEQAQADVVAAESRKNLAQTELKRVQTLFASGAVPQAELDARTAAFEQAEATVAQARARLASAQASVENTTGTLESARGRYLAAEAGPEQVEAARAQVELATAKVAQAKAALEQAELLLSYTKIRAEQDGVVARRTVEVGQLVSPERPLLAVVPLKDTWIVANFKEDQLAAMRPGQPVKIEVDAYEGRELHGHVDSLAAGTGSRFSLLPPDNASGNFTKVVQRVPVLVRFDDQPDVVLRPGMSATVTVVTKGSSSS